jgi:hypothetical protein
MTIFRSSHYGAQLCQFVVEIGDAALWLGWLFPRIQRKATDDHRLLEGKNDPANREF